MIRTQYGILYDLIHYKYKRQNKNEREKGELKYKLSLEEEQEVKECMKDGKVPEVLFGIIFIKND